MVVLMTSYRSRSSYEPEWPPYTKVAARRAVRVTVGQELRARCEVSRDLSHEMLTLLRQLREREDEK